MRHGHLLLVFLLLTPLARGDDDVLRALEARVTRAARENGPSIACVLVSRSDAYHKAPHWGVPPDPDRPDRLGRFDAAAARRLLPEDAPRRALALRQIAEHDLSADDAVPESYGSGFVVDRSGLVLTNAHVVKNATRVYVRLSGKRGSWADIHALDYRSDLAVLRLLDPPEGLKPLALGDGGAVSTGQLVLSLCNAFAPGTRDYEPTVRSGKVISLRQSPPGQKLDEAQLFRATLHGYGTLIQTDADVTPGCSGAALLDLDGKVIGLMTALVGITGDRPGGYVIPIDRPTQKIIDVLKRGEEVEYGFLGVIIDQPRRFGRVVPDGVYLFKVAPGSPASRSGLRAGDVIIGVNGKEVRKNADLFLHVGMGLNGSTAAIEVRRGFGTQKFNVKLGKFYVPGPVVASKRPAARFGLRVDHASILTQRNPFPAFARPLPDGVVIRDVVPESPADRARLQPDKLITHVNSRAVPTPADYHAEMARAGNRVKLTVVSSEGRSLDVTLDEK